MRAKDFFMLIGGLAALFLVIFISYAVFVDMQYAPMSPQEEQVAALKNEQALQALKNKGKAIENDGKKIDQQTKRLEQAAALQDLPGVKHAAEVQAVVWAWMPLAALFVVPSSLLLGLVIHRKTQLIPIKATADGIETRLPSREITMVCKETVGVMGKEAMARSLSYTETVSHERFQEVVAGVSALKGLIGKGNAQIHEALPPVVQALPAFTGQVSLSQCRQDSDYEEGYVCWGRNYDDGGLVQMPLEEIQSLVKNGMQGQGKTVATLLEVYSAFSRKYIRGENVRVFLIDKHAGFPQSLSNRIESLLPGGLSLFDRIVHGADIADNGELLAFLTEQIDECKQRQTNGMTDASLDIIICDEYTETVTDSKDGQAIERIVKRLLNYRKALKYMSVVLFESSKNQNSAKGNSIARMGKSKMMFAGDTDDAGRFLGWKNAENADGLEKGQCVLRLADVKDVVKVQLAQVSDLDFAPFAKYVTAQAKMPDSQPESRGLVDDIRAWMDADPDSHSQRKLAKLCEVSQTKISDYVNGKDRLTAQEKAVIYARLHEDDPAEMPGVISFESFKKARLTGELAANHG